MTPDSTATPKSRCAVGQDDRDAAARPLRDAFAPMKAADSQEAQGARAGPADQDASGFVTMQAGTHLVFRSVDFGADATGFRAWVRACAEVSWIEIRLDSLSGPRIGKCLVAKRELGDAWGMVETGIYGATGVHALYLICTGIPAPRFELDWCGFSRDEPLDGKRLGGTLLPEQVPYLGPKEDNFFGSGCAGAGGDVSGVWIYLIGPSYSGETYLRREEIRLVVDGRDTGLDLRMRRARGTGLFYGRQRLGDLDVWLLDFANRGEPWVARLILVDNRSTTIAHTVSAGAHLQPADSAPVDTSETWRGWYNTCSASIHADAAVCIDHEGLVQYLDLEHHEVRRRAVVAFTDPDGSAYSAGSELILETSARQVAPGQGCTMALYHAVQDRDGPVDECLRSLRARNAVLDAERCIAEWAQWLANGTPLDRIGDQRGRDIVEANLVNIRMLQGLDGGIMATPRCYRSSWIRDNYAALRGMIACGHTDEARRCLHWVDHVFHRLRALGRFGIPTCAAVGYDFAMDGISRNEETWSAETPALYFLLARDYYRSTRDLGTLLAVRESLDYAMDVQLRFAESHEWRLRFNGDETESAGSGIPVTERPGESQWSMTSLAYCMAALDFSMAFLEARGDGAAVPRYRQMLGRLQESMDRNFWREDLGVYDWFRGAQGEWPTVRMTNYHLVPLYYRVPLVNPERAVRSAAAMKHYVDARGLAPNQPGCANGDFCGHTPGYLLSVLVEMNDPLKGRVYDGLVNSGIVGCWGTWSEAYHADGTNYTETADHRMHNLRPFESGINIDAIMRYWGK